MTGPSAQGEVRQRRRCDSGGRRNTPDDTRRQISRYMPPVLRLGYPVRIAALAWGNYSGRNVGAMLDRLTFLTVSCQGQWQSP